MLNRYIAVGEQIAIRELVEADVCQRYLDWLNDPETNQYLESRFSKHTEQSVKTFVSTQLENQTVFLYGLFLKNNHEHIGNIKLGPVNKVHQSAGIGLMIGKPYWGQGYATDAIRVVTKLAFEEMAIQKLTAGCYEMNLGSKKAFEKVGFSVEGFQKSQVNFQNQRIGVWMLGLSEVEYATSYL